MAASDRDEILAALRKEEDRVSAGVQQAREKARALEAELKGFLAASTSRSPSPFQSAIWITNSLRILLLSTERRTFRNGRRMNHFSMIHGCDENTVISNNKPVPIAVSDGDHCAI